MEKLADIGNFESLGNGCSCAHDMSVFNTLDSGALTRAYTKTIGEVDNTLAGCVDAVDQALALLAQRTAEINEGMKSSSYEDYDVSPEEIKASSSLWMNYLMQLKQCENHCRQIREMLNTTPDRYTAITDDARKSFVKKLIHRDNAMA